MEKHYFLTDRMGKNKRYNLTRLVRENGGEATIGRLTQGATIEVGWEGLRSMTMSISKIHATITAAGNLLYLTDNNSGIGTFVNGRRLTDAGYILKNGDEIYIGKHYGPLEIKSMEYNPKEHPNQ